MRLPVAIPGRLERASGEYNQPSKTSMPPTTSRGIQLPRLPRQLTAESPAQIEDRADHTAVAWSSLNLPDQHATYLTLEQCHLRKVGVPRSRLPAARLTDVRIESSESSNRRERAAATGRVVGVSVAGGSIRRGAV